MCIGSMMRFSRAGPQHRAERSAAEILRSPVANLNFYGLGLSFEVGARFPSPAAVLDAPGRE